MDPTASWFLALVCVYVVLSVLLTWKGCFNLSRLGGVSRGEALCLVGIEFVTLVPWACAVVLTDDVEASAFGIVAQSALILWLLCAWRNYAALVSVLTVVAANYVTLAAIYTVRANHFGTFAAAAGLAVPHCAHRIILDGWWLLFKFMKPA